TAVTTLGVPCCGINHCYSQKSSGEAWPALSAICGGVEGTRVDPSSEESLELHQFRSPRDQLQNRVLWRGPWREDHQSSTHLSDDRRAAKGQNDFARYRDRANPVLRLPATGSWHSNR